MHFQQSLNHNEVVNSGLPKYKITFTSPASAKPGFLRINVTPQETRSEIIEAANLEEAEQMAGEERMTYPTNWKVSVEEVSA
jgi:hypothetical protein